MQAYFLVHQLAADAPITPLTGAGLSLWLLGLASNIHADAVLRSLRKPGESGYKIPYGGAYTLVSAANYASEILEWFGYALASSFQLAPVAFSFFTFCNLAPRAHHHHVWYRKKFEDYPTGRSAVVPFVW